MIEKAFHTLLLVLLFVYAMTIVGCTPKPKQLYLIKEDGKFGFIDSLGQKVIEPSFLSAAPFSDGLALVVTDTSRAKGMRTKIDYHYIDETGKTIGKKNYTAYISIIWSILLDMDLDWHSGIDYLSAYSYSEGKALFQFVTNPEEVDEEVKYGYINKKGKVVIPCEYYGGDLFHEGKTMVQDVPMDANGIKNPSSWKVIDENGKSLTDYMFYDKGQYYNHRCLTSLITEDEEAKNQYRAVYVLLDENANIIKTFPNGGMKKRMEEFIVDQIGPLAMFGLGSDFYYANDGSEVTQSYDMSQAWKNNISKNRGFLTDLGKEAHISYVKGYSEGLFVCTTGEKDSEKWFFSDAHGFLYGSINPDLVVFEDALPFSSGLAAVKIDGKWGYINHDFKLVIPCQYDKAESFNGSLAYVESGYANLKIYSYINKRGMPIWQNSKLDN